VNRSSIYKAVLAGAAGAAAVVLAVLHSGADVAPGPGVNPRAVWSEPPETFSARVIATGLEDPYEVAWGPDAFLWITERTGKRVVRIDPADGSRKVAVTIDEVYQKLAQEGLLGLALHPDLLRGSNYVYVMYTYDADAGPAEERRAKIRRYTYDPASETLGSPVDVLTNLPHGPDHGASRLVFGPDRKLYASRGDHGSNFLAYHCVANRAQDLPTAADVRARNWEAYQGKILRVELDGSIPADNPPLKTFFTVSSAHDPRALGNATAALTGLDVYASTAIPGWNASILVASMVSGTIFRIPLNDVSSAPLTYFKAADRYRDLAIAPDGRRIYAVTAVNGRTLTATGEVTASLAHPGSLLEFTYTGTRAAEPARR
jgi:glucose/arabinose dehydrogenase